MNATKDRTEFEQMIRDGVRNVLAEKEDAERLTKVEELLSNANDTVNQLTDTITAKDTELANATEENESLAAKVEELNSKVEELTELLSQSDEEKNALEERASAAESSLAEIERAAKLADRMSELEEANVAYTDEEIRQKQATKVSNMEDEEFAAYKQELVTLRSQMEAAFAKEAGEGKDSQEAAGADATPPANIEKARSEEGAASAANTLDVELLPDDIKNKYLEMAQAMADSNTSGQE